MSESTMGQVKTDDSISRQAALEMLNDKELERQTDDVFDGYLHRYKRSAQRIIAQLPTIDPVKHGEWKLLPSELVSDDGLWGETLYACSNCGYERHVKYRFCPNCGAKMDGKEQKSYADWVVKRE